MTLAVAPALGAAAPLALGRLGAGRVVAEALRELGFRARGRLSVASVRFAVEYGSELIADAREVSCGSAQRFVNAPEGGRRPSAAGRTRRARQTRQSYLANFNTLAHNNPNAQPSTRCKVHTTNTYSPAEALRLSRISALRRRFAGNGSGWSGW